MRLHLAQNRAALLGSCLIVILGCTQSPDKSSTSPGGNTGGTETDTSDSSSDVVECVNTFEVHQAVPETLSETGLYENIVTQQVHPAMLAFTPQFQLWSDGAAKNRWVYLPECESIDTSNMNDWSFPVGTRFFKEFSVDGQRIETRLIERTGTGPRDFTYVSYMWNDDETEAELAPADGVQNAKGTAHDIPGVAACRRCHGSYELGGGRPSRGLGFSAIQLNHADSPTTLDGLIANEQLSHPPDQILEVPGDTVAQAALGYLHANCGSCHNGTSDRVPQVNLSLWLDVGAASVEDTATYATAVSQPNQIFNDQHVTGRIVPGNPDESAVIYRMKQRGNVAQMPPLASEVADADGLQLVREWIESLP